MMLGLPSLPGLQDIPVSQQYEGVHMPVPFPRPVPSGFGLSKFFGARPPWPSTPYGYQHKPLGGLPSAPVLVAGAGALAGGYLLTVANLYVFSKIFDIDISRKSLWLGGAMLYGLQILGSVITGGIAWAAVGPDYNKITQ